MSVESPIKRRISRQIYVGDVAVGGDAPISVQSMTNTETCDVAATVAQVSAIAEAGADIVRVSVPSMEAAEAFREIRAQVSVPLVADIHFDHKIALKVAEYGVDCLRINPGNIGRDDKVREVINSARDKGIPIRIGVNAGSLGKDLQRKYGEPTAEALVESALRHVDILDKFDYQDFKISVKASEVFMAVKSLSFAGGANRAAFTSGYYRGGRFTRWYREVGCRPGNVTDGRYRRHYSHITGSRPGRGGQGRL